MATEKPPMDVPEEELVPHNCPLCGETIGAVKNERGEVVESEIERRVSIVSYWNGIVQSFNVRSIWLWILAHREPEHYASISADEAEKLPENWHLKIEQSQVSGNMLIQAETRVNIAHPKDNGRGGEG